MNPIPLKYQLIAGAVALSLTAAGFYIKGRFDSAAKLTVCETNYNTFRSQVKEEQRLLEAQHAKEKQVLAATAKQSEENWQKADEYYRAHPRIVRVRVPAGCGATAGGAGTGSTAGAQELPVGEPRPSPAGDATAEGLNKKLDVLEMDVAEIERRLNAGIRDAAFIEHVKRHVRKQHENSVQALLTQPEH